MGSRLPVVRNSTLQSPGFTLIELVVVLLIIALLSGLAVVSMRGIMDRYQLSRAVETVQSFDAQARRDARTLRTPVTATIQARRNRLRIGPGTRSADFSLPRGVEISQIRVDRRAALGREVAVRYNRSGVSPTYVVQLQRGRSSLWMVVLGISGQVVTFDNERQVNEILAL